MHDGLRPRIAAWLLLVALWLTAAPAAALAGGSPLHVDPGSPVAKAYALPLGNARSTGSGGGRPMARFGAGLSRTAVLRRHTPRARAAPAAYRVLEPGPGAGLLWMLLAAVVVLACGGAAALLLSRRR